MINQKELDGGIEKYFDRKWMIKNYEMDEIVKR